MNSGPRPQVKSSASTATPRRTSAQPQVTLMLAISRNALLIASRISVKRRRWKSESGARAGRGDLEVKGSRSWYARKDEKAVKSQTCKDADEGPHRNHENAHPSGLEVAVMRVPEYHVATAPPSQARSRISVANAEHDGLHQTARLCNCAARSKYPIYGGALRVFDIFWVEPGPQRAAEDCDSGRDVETSKRSWWRKIDRPSGLSGACLGER
ncbi:hypothetical protein B0H10DRAFT_2196152 [Mycena sp. CBHHK59/15]|nr:hypothetical protein B0H10DRAFT_2196152 [Mycena sp. CBHHK59/15]